MNHRDMIFSAGASVVGASIANASPAAEPSLRTTLPAARWLKPHELVRGTRPVTIKVELDASAALAQLAELEERVARLQRLGVLGPV
jgi:hypothetical protein